MEHKIIGNMINIEVLDPLQYFIHMSLIGVTINIERLDTNPYLVSQSQLVHYIHLQTISYIYTSFICNDTQTY